MLVRRVSASVLCYMNERVPIESVPSTPAHWTGCILKDSRTIQRYITIHSCTLTRTHTGTHWQIHARVVGASRHLTVRVGPQQRNRIRTDRWVWRRSVVLEQRQQVIAAVVRQVGGTQIGQQLVWIGQLREKLNGRDKQNKESKLAQ